MNVIARTLAAFVTMVPFAAYGYGEDACSPNEEELKFSIVTSISGHPKGEAAAAFADVMNAHFDGRYCVVVYGNSELFDDDVIFEAMLNGEATFAAPALAKVSQFTPKVDIFNLPFLFDSDLHALEFLNSDVAAGMLQEFEDGGFYAFGLWSNGMRQMSATVPIRGLRDAEGLTFRVSSSSPITAALYEAMGVSTERMSFSKVYEALSTGQVQGQENTWTNIETKRFYEVQAAVTETNHSYIGYVALTSQRFLNSLAPEDRDFIINAMKLVTHERNRFAFELNQISRQNILDDGGAILRLTSQELNEFRTAFQPIFETFKPEIGSDFVDAAIEINANADPFN